MSAPAIKATFSDFKLIRGRKIAQLVFEVPIEGADQALETLGGVPRPDKEAWVGIARINPSKTTEKTASEASAQDNEPSQKIGRRFVDMPYANQAGIRCDDRVFRKFVEERGADDAAQYVRDACGVASRAEIIKGTKAGNRWEVLEGAFVAWKAVA